MKQKTLVVNDKIPSIIEQGSEESFLKSAAKFSYRYAVALVLILVVVWPLPLYFSGYVFSPVMYYVWVAMAVVWASGSAAVIIALPILEGRGGISKALK